MAFVLAPFVQFRTPAASISTHRRRRTARAKACLPASVAAVEDKRTGARIYVVGCVHGSQVSADDVRRLLDSTSPDAVVLELCQSRLDSLKVVMENDFKDCPKPDSTSTPRKRKRSFRQISQTFGGAGPGAVAVLLELTYRLQTITGVKPGCEFAYPITESKQWQLVCGDAPARDTVGNLYRAFASPLSSLRSSMSSIEDLLARVLFPPKEGVSIAGIFLSEPRRLQELARLSLPAVMISSAISVVSNAGASAFEGTAAVSVLAQGYATSALPLLGALGQTVVVSYVIVSTLRFLKVLIADRDRILAQNILDTATQLQSNGKTTTTICAVVGLLHVNGIVRNIQDGGSVRA